MDVGDVFVLRCIRADNARHVDIHPDGLEFLADSKTSLLGEMPANQGGVAALQELIVGTLLNIDSRIVFLE